MSQKLQAHVHLLAVLFAAFTLLSVPMFQQLRDDSAEAAPKAKDTFMSKFFRDLSQQFKDQKDQDADVEDVWGDLARQSNPDCGATCDPNGDLDGDGVSNADENRQGTNPACNEKTYSKEYCEGKDKYNVTKDPVPPVLNGRRELLLNRTFYANGGQNQAAHFEMRTQYNYTELYLNVTNHQGFDWTVTYEKSDPPREGMCERTRSGTPALTPQPKSSYSCTGLLRPPTGNYTVSLDAFAATSGSWEVVVYGILNGS